MTKIVLMGAACIIASVAPAAANSLYSGTVNGTFDSAVLSGNVIATNGSLTSYDNNLTASYSSTALAPNNDTLSWGYSTTGASPDHSTLNFTGADFTDVAPNQVFKLGRITYLNGTSDVVTLIFAAQLHLDLGSGIDIKTSNIDIVTTVNTGLSLARDADFIAFNDLPVTFNVYEGYSAAVDIYGMIVGDPTVSLDHITLTGGFHGGGFIGSGVGAIPEPTTWAMLTIGFGLAGGAARRRTTTRTIQAI